MSLARETIRLDGTVTDQRLRDAARNAMSSINIQLADYKTQHIALAAYKFSDTSSDTIDDEKRVVMLYRRAVFSTIKADLIEKYPDYDSTDSGLRRAEDLRLSVDEQRRNANWAVRDILGKPRTVVELI